MLQARLRLVLRAAVATAAPICRGAAARFVVYVAGAIVVVSLFGHDNDHDNLYGHAHVHCCALYGDLEDKGRPC